MYRWRQYLIILLVLVSLFPIPPKASATPPFQLGINVLIYGNDPDIDIAARTDTLLAKLKKLNVNSLSLAFPFFQNDWQASSLYTNSYTLSDENILLFAKKSSSLGFSTMLRPILDETSLSPSSRWRGDIQPSSVARWFASYTQLMIHYAKIAQRAGVSIFDIGTELNTLAEPAFAPYWNILIAQVRQVFSGKLVYSSNHDVEVYDTGFWSLVDYVGVDAFFGLNPSSRTKQGFDQAWYYVTTILRTAQLRYNKPILLTEIGIPSQVGAVQKPWVWNNHGSVDLALQLLYYQSACTVLQPIVRGLYFWTVTIYPTVNPLMDTGFDFLGKPAQQAVENC